MDSFAKDNSESSKDLLDEWERVQKQLADLKDLELNLRNEVFATYFVNPKEGTNNHTLPDGRVLKGNYKINRTLDEALLHTKATELMKAGLVLRDLVRMKPELNTKPYRALDDKQRVLFEQVLDIKVGTPALEIVTPKEKR